jgi:transposase
LKHVAIDLGGKESQVCIRGADGAVLEEYRHPTRKLANRMREWGQSRVIVETSAEAFRVADQALAAGHEVRVVAASLVKSLGVGQRGVKTDQRDARVLSEVSCRIDLPSVHIPSELSRKLKSLCGGREALVNSRTLLINNVRGWARTQLWRIRSGGTPTFPKRVRAHAEAIEQELPAHIVRALVVIETLNEQIRDSDQELKRLSQDLPVCRRLMTMPGVGPVTALRFLAAIDEVARFGSGHAVESYLGLTPGENSSSDRQRRTGITKAGPRAVRAVLIQAAWTAYRTRALDPMVHWAKRIERRRGKFIAVVALARKMVGILFAMWRDSTVYNPLQGAKPSATA